MMNHGNFGNCEVLFHKTKIITGIGRNHSILSSARYKPFGAYSHSKLANILHANELSRRLKVVNHII